MRINCGKCYDRTVQGATTLRPRQKGSLASAPGFREPHSGPSPAMPLSHQAKRQQASVGHPGYAHLEPTTTIKPPGNSRGARIPCSKGPNPLLGPEQTSLEPPAECGACAYVSTSEHVKHSAWGRLWTGTECVVWVAHTQAEEAPGSSGQRQEWEGKEEWPQSEDKGLGHFPPESCSSTELWRFWKF